MADSIGRILYVDNDLFFLEKFRQEFSSYENIRVVTAINGEIAFKSLELFRTDLVICNLNLPDMDGMKFLLMVKLKYPRVDRIILSEQSDEERAKGACSRGCALFNIIKPWYDERVKDDIVRLIDDRSKNKENSLQIILDEISIMPTLSHTYSEILVAVSEEASFSRLSDIISKDISLSTLILRIANSAFYGFEKTNSLERAITIVGAQQLKDIALNHSLTKNMRWSEKHQVIVSEISIHSLIVNRYLYVFHHLKHGTTLPKEYSSIGITHDIGKLMLLQFFPDKYDQIVQYINDNKQFDFYQSELKLGYDGYTHCEIGAYFLKYWNLPEENEISALYHHNPADSIPEMRDILLLLNFVDAFVNFIWKNRKDQFWDPEDFRYDSPFGKEELKKQGDAIVRDFFELIGNI